MDTVRLARDLGDVSGLFPTGISRLRDIPYQLLQAIRAALVFLTFEELPEGDEPPRSIWTHSEALEEHFDRVRRRRKAKMDGRDDEPEFEPQRNAALDMLIAR